VGHGRSNSFDRMIALEPFRRSASGRNKLPTYLPMIIRSRLAKSDLESYLSHLPFEQRGFLHLPLILFTPVFIAKRWAMCIASR